METADARNVISRIVNAAPNGNAINEADVLEWKKTPFVQELCKAVQQSDMLALFSLMNEADWPVANLATSLLRAFKDDPRVRQHYLATWKNRHRPLEVRFCVMYPLLDYPDLPRSLHEEFFAAIIANVNLFKAFALTYFVTPDQVLPTVKSRIIDRKYPASKRWVYLCNALASPHESEALEFIESFKNDSDEFVARVARTLIANAGEIST